ncbi:efflux RND transporter periplasmic adaptor subunit [Kineothrix sp. MB12-C1]|uniref:efflux RND transporter periplasmic adaptor subunit n=1 Tax=Kineothrix sp. MB12-C1 TaxID=3070215 RepID=UPI0027D310A2|nr:efflux RND transporter periplasmic adaptor subunit [Kineothrix sp. MB12-C1]WMC91473.1 efflux RND transporter periplasmic adaptor subunit [Kineothrix sp. MB12-C1]
MAKVKELLTKHKKLAILLCVIIVLASGVLAVRAQVKKGMEAMNAAMNKQEIAAVERRSLVSSISATGTIVSAESRDIVVNLSGIEVETVAVEVGDSVIEGDILLEFDSTDIEESLEDAKTALNASGGRSDISVSSSERSLQEAQATRDINAERANQDVADAWNDYLEALTDLEEAEGDYEDAKQTTIEKKGELEGSQARSSEAQSKMTEAQALMESLSGQFDSIVAQMNETYPEYSSQFNEKLHIGSSELSGLSSTNLVPDEATEAKAYVDGKLVDLIGISNQYHTAKGTYDTAAASYNSSSAEIASWQSKYATAQGNEATYEKAIDAAESAVDNMLNAYNNQVRSQEDSTRNNASTVAAKEDGLKSDKLTASTATLSDKKQVKQYETQLEDCIVKAPFAGVVTAVNVEEGDMYKGDTLITIEDTSAYEVSAEIDEYDISSIELGQKAVIKTNGTGDAQLDGMVTDIAPRATQSTGTDVTYNIKISVDTKNDDLRLDMTAKLSIILESKDNIVTVPYDAVQTDDEGKKYVEVVNETAEGEEVSQDSEEAQTPENTTIPANTRGPEGASGRTNTKKVYITTGIESDYYVEVESGELTEGMQVVVQAAEQSLNMENIMRMQGPMGGF